MRTSTFLILSCVLALPAGAQSRQATNPPESPSEGGPKVDTVIPGKYNQGMLHKMVFGAHYRELWNTPIEVPVLNLATYRGGLTPVKRGGSRQTIGLRFKAGNGLEYNFRSVDKEPANALPPSLKKSPVEKVFQDQMSAQYPAATLIASSILDAAGVLHPHPAIFVMPDDERLGEFRKDFAGLLGTIEEHRPKFPGARDIVETQELFDSLARDPHQRVDAREYLRARLVDILVGDWDRHADQWQWTSFPEAGDIRWLAVPEDRDWAFSRMDGPIASMVRQYYPQTIGFEKNYPSMLDLTWTAKDLDRRLLSGLDRPAWDSVVSDVQRRVTDAAIAKAVNNQPAAFQRIAGKEMREALVNRRNDLDEAAAEFYDLLAQIVDIHATDATEVVDVKYEAKGAVRISIRTRGRDMPRTTFLRTFDPALTKEIRVYLHGGDDIALMRGTRSDILVRIIGGERDRLVDSTHSGHSLYPDRIENKVEPEAPAKKESEPKKVSEKKEEPKTEKVKEELADRGPSVPEVMQAEHFGPMERGEATLETQPVDWGHRWVQSPWAAYHPGQGVLVGWEINRFGYGFRANPYRTRARLKAGWAFGAMGPRIELSWEDRQFLQPMDGKFDLGARIDIRVSKVEVIKFYGWGNESTRTNPGNVGRALQDMIRFAPAFFYAGDRWQITAGPNLALTNPQQEPGTPLATVRPLGTDRMVLLGFDATTTWNVGMPMGAGTGARLRFDGRIGRSINNSSASFARGGLEGAAYMSLPLPRNPVFAVRAGGQRALGRYPFQEGAILGGQSTLRGYDKQRFVGDASLYAGSEIRVPVTEYKGNDVGVLALADVGRVFLDGEVSSTWHHALGGGIWAGAPGLIMLNLTLARSERWVVQVYTGFGF